MAILKCAGCRLGRWGCAAGHAAVSTPARRHGGSIQVSLDGDDVDARCELLMRIAKQYSCTPTGEPTHGGGEAACTGTEARHPQIRVSAGVRIDDVIIFGATGFTGRLVAEYLNSTYGVGGEVTWAMAGRSLAKLEQVRGLIGAPQSLPLLEAEAADAAGLATLVARRPGRHRRRRALPTPRSRLDHRLCASRHRLRRPVRRASLDGADDPAARCPGTHQWCPHRLLVRLRLDPVRPWRRVPAG